MTKSNLLIFTVLDCFSFVIVLIFWNNFYANERCETESFLTGKMIVVTELTYLFWVTLCTITSEVWSDDYVWSLAILMFMVTLCSLLWVLSCLLKYIPWTYSKGFRFLETGNPFVLGTIGSSWWIVVVGSTKL